MEGHDVNGEDSDMIGFKALSDSVQNCDMFVQSAVRGMRCDVVRRFSVTVIFVGRAMTMSLNVTGV